MGPGIVHAPECDWNVLPGTSTVELGKFLTRFDATLRHKSNEEDSLAAVVGLYYKLCRLVASA
ncbi:hypothetical protein KIPB_012530, partial [Kipferlia bialata]|eukprot:g12530.t1